MLKRAQLAGFRALALGSLLGIACLFAWGPASSSASTAQVSIVNGKTTSIEKWPWQVALLNSQKPGQDRSPRFRTFCGGSLITPDLVVTAGHCVADMSARQAKKVEILSGRTRLNDESEGTVTKVAKVLMPVDRRGKRKYDISRGGALWDIALLQLETPLDSPTIKIAGGDEAASWKAGQLVRTTGWGVTGSDNRRASSVLRVASQVMLPDHVCKRFNGQGYDVKTMNCLGGPSVNTTTCFGDSGGPLVAPVSGEYRLVGLTSFGDPYCSPNLPSVDSRVAGAAMRNWVRSTALDVSGVDVVGRDGTAAAPGTWCQIPNLNGMTVKQARVALVAQGCRLGHVNRSFAFYFSDIGRVIGSYYVKGWLAPVGTKVQIWIGR